MDERQTQIQVGKGLEESRLNTEFIDLLKKYSTPALVILAVVVGGYALWSRYAAHRKTSLDAAFVELDSAQLAKNPKSLAAIAEEHSGKGAVALRANLDAADIHLRAARLGVPSGVTVDIEGALPADSAALTAEQRQAELAEAERQYKAVVEGADDSTGQRLLAWNALMGLGAINESRNELDSARANYSRVITEAKDRGFGVTALVAQQHLDTLDALKNAPTLLNNSQLHASVQPVEQPITLPMTDIQMKTPDGVTIRPGEGTTIMPLTIGPDGNAIVTPPPPPGQPAPTPAAPTPPVATPPPSAQPTTPPASAEPAPKP